MNALRVALSVVALSALASAVALNAATGASSDGNRFEATFSETNASITNRISDLGVFQLINTGTGTVEGFGAATVVLGATQDRSVEPCGPGSWTNAALRRIVLGAGVLVLRELVHICQTATGPVGTGTWAVDGGSSTGLFAGARGSGETTIQLATRTATLTGKLKLANTDGGEGAA
jgi:hypothetical protein